MTLSRYDAWLTSPPEASRNACTVCGESAFEPTDREDRPHAVTRDGDGVLCSPRCVAADSLEHHWRDTPADRVQRVAAVREALLEGADLDVMWLRVETFSHRHGEGEAVVHGCPCDWDGVSVTLETSASESGEATIAWSRVLDAGLGDGASQVADASAGPTA